MNQDELRAAADRNDNVFEYMCENDPLIRAAKHCKAYVSECRKHEELTGLGISIEIVADAYLTEHPADSNEPATSEWWERVQPEGEKIIQILEIGCDSLLSFGGKCVCDNPTRRQVRCLAEACGVVLREGGRNGRLG